MIRSVADSYTTTSSHNPATTLPSSNNNNNSPALSYSTASTSSYASHPATHARLAERVDSKIKLCCTGDGGVGKTCLLMVYSRQPFPSDYVPTVFENYVVNKRFDSKLVEFALWDTAGQEEYDRLRPLSYPESNVIFICFAVDFPDSLANVEDKWAPEVAHFCEGVPVVLVATKIDLRQDQTAIGLLQAQGRQPVTHAEGSAVARRIGASYAEVSALRGLGVDDVFDLALREAMGAKSSAAKIKRKVKCIVL